MKKIADIEKVAPKDPRIIRFKEIIDAGYNK